MSKLYNLYKQEETISLENYKKGLDNLGNTCYMNTILQCLRVNKEFSSYFLNKDFYQGKESILRTELHTKKSESFLTIGWFGLLKKLWNQNEEMSVKPTVFFNYYQRACKDLQRNNLFGFNQNDADEFLLFFLNCLHDSLCDKDLTIVVSGDISNTNDQIQKDYYDYLKKHLELEGVSIVKGLFTGFQVSTIENSYNETKSHNFEPFLYINLEIPNNSTTIHDCLQHYTEKSVLDKDYKDKKLPETTTYTKTTKFMELPQYLIIVLKRFTKQITPKGIQLKKNNSTIKYPFTLDMTPYVHNSIGKGYLYDLQSVAFHSGNIYGGHYFCVCKSDKNEWILYNDSQTGILENADNIINNQAYILFYKKQ